MMKRLIYLSYLRYLSFCILIISCNNNTIERQDKDVIINTTDNKASNLNVLDQRFSNGQLKAKGQFKNGKRDSLWISYYPNGNKQSENYYSNDLLSGNTVSYYENGKLRYVGFYLEGKKHGKWMLWDLEGKQKVIQYENGIKK